MEPGEAIMKAMGSSAGERLSVVDLELEVIHRAPALIPAFGHPSLTGNGKG
jgi:hypothetical protein